MTQVSRPTKTGWWRLLLAAIAAALVGLLSAGTASAATLPEVETRVGASTPVTAYTVGVHECITAGQRWGHAPPQGETMAGCGVAANSERLLARADRIEQHLTRLDHSPANDAMLARIRSAATSGSPLSKADRAFMRHESTEAWLMDRGVGYGPAHRVAGWTHRTFGNYDPSVIKQFPEYFGTGWKRYWGIE